MNRWRRSIVCALWFCPGLLFLVCFTFLAPAILWGLFFLAMFSGFYGLALLLAPLTVPTVQTPAHKPVQLSTPLDDGLPYVPRTLDELRRMDPEDFEIFSAAVLIGMGQGYRFYEHCGQSGDQGVDVKLRNVHDQVVAVQCKRNAENNTIGSPLIREFAGSILHHHVAYGYFVTTSAFTPDARVVINNNMRIRVIDGQLLQGYLKWRAREIALALREVNETLGIG